MSGSLSAKVAGLDDLIAQIDRVRAAACADDRFGFDEPWAVFIRQMRLLSAQAYGTRVQKWLTEFYGWATVPAGADRGDVLDGDGLYQEVKVTFLTASNPGANFVQIRPHQNLDGYELFVVLHDFNVVRFRLTKKQMAAELALFGQTAHGTTKAVAGNATREYAIRFTLDSEHGQRWLTRYVVPSGITAKAFVPAC